MMTLTQSEPVVITQNVITELRDLHPPAGKPVSPLPLTAPYITLNGNDIPRYRHEFTDDGAAPGPSGWTSDLILPLITDQRCQNGIAVLLMLIINGEGSGRLKHMLLAGRGLPTYKPNHKIRPITMPEVWYKIAGKLNLKQVDQAKIFPTIQFGTKVKGGSERALHIVQTQLEQHIHSDPTNTDTATVAISTDVANAFNTCSRHDMFDALMSNPHTQPLLRMFHWSHAHPSDVLVYDHGNNSRITAIIPASEGVRQGDLLAGLSYNVSVQRTYIATQQHIPQVKLVAVYDDLTIVGPQAHAFKAFDHFTQLLAQRGDLKLQYDKCRVLIPTPQAATDHTVTAAVQAQCTTRNLTLVHGCMSMLGGCVGSDDTMATHIASEAVQAVVPLLDALTHDKMPSQSALLLIRYCVISRL